MWALAIEAVWATAIGRVLVSALLPDTTIRVREGDLVPRSLKLVVPTMRRRVTRVRFRVVGGVSGSRGAQETDVRQVAAMGQGRHGGRDHMPGRCIASRDRSRRG